MAAALRDAQKIYRESMSLVERALVSSATPADLPLLCEPGLALKDDRLEAVFGRLHLWDFVNVGKAAPFPPVQFWNWMEWLPHSAREIRRLIDQFQERYNFIAPPNLCAAVHGLSHHYLLAMAADYAVIMQPSHPVLPGGFAALAREIQPLRDAIRQLQLDLAPDEAPRDGMLSHEIIERVVLMVEQHPMRTDAAPYRPA
jgi:hypothetical protein